MKDNKNKYLIIVSLFLGLFITEVFFQIIYSHKKKFEYASAEERFILFDSPDGEMYDVRDKYFKYKPNKKILAETYFKKDKSFIKEFSYIIHTNNYGLVQKKNLSKEKKSILFLGASFVEGQGASAWINEIDNESTGFQLINGGIMGTGPQQMEILEEEISKDFNVERVLFFYNGGLMRRDPFIINNNTIKCIKDYKSCEGDENFYGFPIKKKDPNNFLLFLDNYRVKSLQENKSIKNLRRSIKTKIFNLYIVKIPTNFLKNKFYKSGNEKIKKNFTSMSNLISKYGRNIYFIKMNTLYEIGMGESYETMYAESFLKSKKINHFYCDFENNIDNFYPNDGHPNKKGYESLKNCVQDILDKQIF